MWEWNVYECREEGIHASWIRHEMCCCIHKHWLYVRLWNEETAVAAGSHIRTRKFTTCYGEKEGKRITKSGEDREDVANPVIVSCEGQDSFCQDSFSRPQEKKEGMKSHCCVTNIEPKEDAAPFFTYMQWKRKLFISMYTFSKPQLTLSHVVKFHSHSDPSSRKKEVSP